MTSQAERRGGFSLLEVIIATGILATSTVLLLSLFATGERHAKRAEERVFAQMLCQSTLDELLADPSQLQRVEDELLAGYGDWTYSVDWTPTDIEGLVRLHVSVKHVDAIDQLENRGTVSDRNVFELVRWTRFETHSNSTLDRSSHSIMSPTLP
jgi:type II secretion system protein I